MFWEIDIMKKIISFITALTVLISVLFNISISASEVTDADFSEYRPTPIKIII